MGFQRVERREMVARFWFFSTEERERERGFLEKLINEFFISLYYFNVKYH